VSASEDGLRRVTLPQESAAAALLRLGAAGEAPPDLFHDLETRLCAYYEGKPADFPDNLDPAVGTLFRRQVWEAARRIPYGETGSYGKLAAQIGKPGAARAVGNALGRNPFSVIVPCHRVVAAGGIGGFSGDGGPEMKRRLLALEAGEPQAVV
jgi:methylated-DNA-[protein]-cysteine S-methyltransferase